MQSCKPRRPLQRAFQLASVLALVSVSAPASLRADNMNVNSIKKEMERYRDAKTPPPSDKKKREQEKRSFDAFDKKLKSMESELMEKVAKTDAKPAAPAAQADSRAQMARLSSKPSEGKPAAKATTPVRANSAPAAPAGKEAGSIDIMKLASAVDNVLTAPRIEEVKSRVGALEAQSANVANSLRDLQAANLALVKRIEESQAAQTELLESMRGAKPDEQSQVRLEKIEKDLARQAEISASLGRSIEELTRLQASSDQAQVSAVAAPNGEIEALKALTVKQAKVIGLLQRSTDGLRADLAATRATMERISKGLADPSGRDAPAQQPATGAPAPAAPPADPAAKKVDDPSGSAPLFDKPAPPAAVPAQSAQPDAMARAPQDLQNQEATARAMQGETTVSAGVRETTLGREPQAAPDARAAYARVNSLSDTKRVRDVEEFDDWEYHDFEPSDAADMRTAVVLVTKAKLITAPGEDDEVVSVVPKGSRLLVEQRRGSWYRVIAPNGRHAWIHGKMLGFVGEDPDSALVNKGAEEKLLEGS